MYYINYILIYLLNQKYNLFKTNKQTNNKNPHVSLRFTQQTKSQILISGTAVTYRVTVEKQSGSISE